MSQPPELGSQPPQQRTDEAGDEAGNEAGNEAAADGASPAERSSGSGRARATVAAQVSSPTRALSQLTPSSDPGSTGARPTASARLAGHGTTRYSFGMMSMSEIDTAHPTGSVSLAWGPDVMKTADGNVVAVPSAPIPTTDSSSAAASGDQSPPGSVSAVAAGDGASGGASGGASEGQPGATAAGRTAAEKTAAEKTAAEETAAEETAAEETAASKAEIPAAEKPNIQPKMPRFPPTAAATVRFLNDSESQTDDPEFLEPGVVVHRRAILLDALSWTFLLLTVLGADGYSRVFFVNFFFCEFSARKFTVDFSTRLFLLGSSW